MLIPAALAALVIGFLAGLWINQAKVYCQTCGITLTCPECDQERRRTDANRNEAAVTHQG